MHQEIFITHTGNRNECSLWDNVKQPIGVVQLIAGATATARQYDNFANFLNKNGYVVCVAHGPLHGAKIFENAVADGLELLGYLKHHFKIPVFLIGHGYGSFVTQYMMEHTDLCTAGICLSGAALYSPAILLPAIAAAWIGMKISGVNAPARALEFFMHAPRPGLSYGFYYSLLKNIAKLRYRRGSSIPLLIISGARDLTTLNGRLTKSLYNAYQAVDMENLTLIIYPDAPHELLTGPNYRDVQRDILKFLNSAGPGAIKRCRKK